jgi:hypothetical protein
MPDPRWIAGLILLAGVLALSIHLSATTMEYSRYNQEWNGTSRLFQALEDRGARDYTAHSPLPAEGALLLIMVPAGDYGPGEAGELRAFLGRGNTVVLVDDAGSGNSLLSGLDSGIRIRTGNLTSADRVYADPSSVTAFPEGDDPLNAGVQRLALNRPAWVEGGIPVFSTSILSWEDSNGDGKYSSGEEMGHFTVAAREAHGNGTLYVIADPSIFINGMQSPGATAGNALLVERILSAGPLVLAEQGHSRTASAGGVIRVIHFIQDSIPIKMALLTILVMGLALIFWQRSQSR